MANNIALICDDNYVVPTMVCIKSIIMNVKAETLIHVCSFGLSQKNMEAFRRMSTEKVQVMIDVFSGEKYEALFNRINQKTHVTPTALIKFELPDYFLSIDKLLYLDSDIIIRQDISPLFSLDLQDCYLAASWAYYKYLQNLRFRFKRHRDRFYFNSGVMMMNLAKMREDRVSEKMWDYKLNRATTELMDQESLNAVCGNRAYPLPIRWNCDPRLLTKENLETLNAAYNVSYDSIEALVKDIAVIHYINKKTKPWVYSTAPMRECWMEVYESIEDIPEIHPIIDDGRTDHANSDASVNRRPSIAKRVLRRLNFVKRIHRRLTADKAIFKEWGAEGLICYRIYRLKQLSKRRAHKHP